MIVIFVVRAHYAEPAGASWGVASWDVEEVSMSLTSAADIFIKQAPKSRFLDRTLAEDEAERRNKRDKEEWSRILRAM